MKLHYLKIYAYGEQSDNLLVNFTNWSNEELLAICKKAESLVQWHFYRIHPLKRIYHSLQQFRNFIARNRLRSYEKIMTFAKSWVHKLNFIGRRN